LKGLLPSLAVLHFTVILIFGYIKLRNIFYFISSQTQMNMSIAAEILLQQEDHA